MKIQMEPTEHIVKIDGVECRAWNAVTERGSQLIVFVHSIATPDGAPADPADQRDLDEQFNERHPTEIVLL